MPFTPRRVGGVAYSLVMFVVVSVLSGVLIAGLFVPLAGLANGQLLPDTEHDGFYYALLGKGDEALR